jgi:uncharacterized protein involved in exopolysaccharide biosynthesis
MSTQRLPAPHGDDLEGSGSAIPWSDIVSALWHHRRTVITIFSVGFTVSMLWGWASPPEYRAKALLMVKDQRAQMTVSPDARSHNFVDPEREDEVNSLMTLAFQPAVILAAVDAATKTASGGGSGSVEKSFVVWAQDWIVGLKYQVLGIPDQLYRMLHGIPPPTDDEQRVARVRGDLQFTPLPDSNLVEIAYQSRNPYWAARVVNTLTSQLITTYTRLYESTDAYKFYQDQRNLLAETLSKAEAELVRFRDNVGPELLAYDMADLHSRVADLERELIDTSARRAEIVSQLNAPAQAIVADAHSQDEEAGTVGNPAIGSLKGRLVELEIQRSELLSRYTPKSAAIRDIDRQIADAKRLLEQERGSSVEMHRLTARARLDANEARVAAITDQLSKYRATITKLEDVLPEWNRIQNDVQTQKEAYLNYLRKEEEARISSALDESQIVNIAIAERAAVPTEPESGQLRRRVLVGTFLSGLLAVGLALLRDWMDPSVKTAAQAERLAGLPVLGELQA